MILSIIFHLIFSLLILFSQRSAAQLQAHLYHSDRVSDNDLQSDCLFYNGSINFPNVAFVPNIHHSYHMIPFCIRSPSMQQKLLRKNASQNDHGTSITFETLRTQNITSEQLYFSFAPIDVIERYQEFLESPEPILSTQVFHNCSKLWFGEFCQYTFNSTLSFKEILQKSFQNKQDEDRPDLPDFFNRTICYPFLKCHRGPSPACIDWREICDGKIDCLDGGEDELGCDELDINECTTEEFRCQNGFCIPKDFFDDDYYNPDCIDRSDEQVSPLNGYESAYSSCPSDPRFRCVESKCLNERLFSCGDGRCQLHMCPNNRNQLIWQAMFSQAGNLHLSFDCWTSLICLIGVHEIGLDLFPNTQCPETNISERMMRDHCPAVFFFPKDPVILGHIRFAYTTDFINTIPAHFLLPDYVCYDEQLCESLPATIRLNQSTCRSLLEFKLDHIEPNWRFLEKEIRKFFFRCLTRKEHYVQCPKSKPIRCANSSKCVALNRLVDNFIDCPHGDDEQIEDSCSLPDRHYRFRCLSGNKCIPMYHMVTDFRNCIGNEISSSDGLNHYLNRNSQAPSSFSILCDGFIDHRSIDNLNYTDETDCEQWPCNTAYTRCDDRGVWNCLNGADEVNCSQNPCRPNGHPCILSHNYNFTCLPLSRFNDGHIDCLGAFDERMYCRTMDVESSGYLYQCSNERKCILMNELCDKQIAHCASGEDEGHLCQMSAYQPGWCQDYYGSPYWTLNKNSYLCILEVEPFKRRLVFFSLKNHLVYPTEDHNHAVELMKTTTVVKITDSDLRSSNDEHSEIYTGGLTVYSSDLKEKFTLCSPAYFGNRCEYQSQRVSLTLQFRAPEWRILFTFVIMLIDNKSNIHSFELLDYLSIRNCREKYNFYLLYLTRPKNENCSYAVRIDVYEKMKMKYYASMLYHIRFQFLPVHRLSFQVDVPVQGFLTTLKSCPLKCLHGQCRRFVNSEKLFCQCSHGYSGTLCTIRDSCNCSPKSLCIGMVNNRSICLCPLTRFGPRCYLPSTACISNPCGESGQCIPSHEQHFRNGFYCICFTGFSGSRCQIRETKIEISFPKDLFIPQTILVHFIHVPPPPPIHILDEDVIYEDPSQAVILSKIRFDQNSTILYYAKPFHLIFVEFNHNYFLALLQHEFRSNILTTIIPEHRCRPIHELLDNHTQHFSRWHRAKYYHLPCQQRFDLVCFYDNDLFMCLCDRDHHANCFKFDFHRVHNCLGYNYCENNGQCYQDDAICPSASFCFCTECYYGSRCQFTSTGFGLSLDAILGYSIWPNISFSRQPVVVKVSAALTSFMFIAALINSSLLMITFRSKQLLKIGCGLYLLVSSITSLITMIMFSLKFLFLLLSQMSIITNYYFLLSNCIGLDLFLKAFLAICDWLHACVAIERVLTIQIGIKFSKIKSKRTAKWVIIGIFLFIFATFIPDPIHRHLLEDEEEQRRWCVIRYSSWKVQTFALFMNIFHFLVPFMINIISNFFVIIIMARQKARRRPNEQYRHHLCEQFHQHKHHLISSFVLVIIALPRLVIFLTSKCIKSARDPWLFLASYFISFLPPLLTFIVFVLPSETYRKEFKLALTRLKRAIQRRFHHE